MRRPADDDVGELLDTHAQIVAELAELSIDARSTWDALSQSTRAHLLDHFQGEDSEWIAQMGAVTVAIEQLADAYRALHSGERERSGRRGGRGRRAGRGSNANTDMRQNVIDGVVGMNFPSAWEVGGSRRDTLMGKPIKDVDVMVAGVSAHELKARCAAEGHVEELTVAGDLVGVRLRASWTPQEGVEIALARTEISTGTGHKDFKIAPIAPPAGWENMLWATRAQHDQQLREHVLRDLERRDFTRNAIARNVVTGEELDPFDGAADIRDGIVRTVSPDSFRDDPLRMYRLLARMAKDEAHPDPETLAQLRHHAALLQRGTLSGERLREELLKTLSGPAAADALRLAEEVGLLEIAVPEWKLISGYEQGSKYHALTASDHSLLAVQRACELDAPQRVRLTMLLHDIGKGDPDVAWVWAVDVASGKRRGVLVRDASALQAAGEIRDVSEQKHYAACPKFKRDGEIVTTLGAAHEDKSAEHGERALWRLKCDAQTVKDVTKLSAAHMFTHDDDFLCRRLNADRLARGAEPLTAEQIAARQQRKAREFIAEHGRDYAEDLMLVRLCDRSAKSLDGLSAEDRRELDAFRSCVRSQWEQPLTRAELAIDGRVVAAAGLKGPAIGEAQRRLLQRVISEPELNTAEQLTHELKGIVKQLKDWAPTRR